MKKSDNDIQSEAYLLSEVNIDKQILFLMG